VKRAVETRDRLYIAKALSLIEDGVYSEISDMIFSSPRAHIVGITGSPGVGKSTLINALISELRKRGKSVAILAIDPSSPISGGALLGNRIRVRSLDEATFYRSISTPPERSLPLKAYLMIELLNTIGFDYILIETPGAGQVNVSISKIADTVVIVVQPLTGDDIQMLKAGIMEIGDIYVVNKADLPQAELTATYLRTIIGDVDRDGWRMPIIKTSAISGKGVAELVNAIDQHLLFLKSRNLYTMRFQRRRMAIVEEYVLNILHRHFASVMDRVMVDDVSLENPLNTAKSILSTVLAMMCRTSEGGSTAH